MDTLPRTHNNPPDPLDEALAPFADDLAEAENWLDGSPVETEAQMHVVDALTKAMKAAKKAVEAVEESCARPFYDQWKAEKARFAPTITDLDLRIKGLVATVAAFKKRVAEQKAEAERKARAEAEAKMRAAQEAARQAAASDYEAQRRAIEAEDAAKAAAKAAQVAAKDTVKGMRTVTRHQVTDHKALLNWIARNRRDDLTAFIDDWAQKNHRHVTADGLTVWQEKEAF